MYHNSQGKLDALGPSLDRIVPGLGYVPGNVRFVTNIVNIAMNEWGEDAFRAMLDAYAENRRSKS